MLLALAPLLFLRLSLASSDDNLRACRLATGKHSPYSIEAKPYSTGNLHSPNFGKGRFYPPNNLCRWMIIAPPEHVIFINITTLQIDDSPSRSGHQAAFPGSSSRSRSSIILPSVDISITGNDVSTGCEGDYLEILDGNDYRQRHQLIGRYCGDLKTKPVVSVYNQVQIIFQSDGFKEDIGFNLQFMAVSPEDVSINKEGRIFIESLEMGHQRSPKWGFNSHENELISARTRYELLDFPMIGPSSSLLLYGGGVANRAKFNGHDESCSAGARIMTADEGNFSSPNFGRGQYPPGSHCEWLITAPRDRVVSFQFDDLQLEYGLETRGCTFDYVEIFDGRDPTAPVLGRFCGRAVPKLPIRSTSNYLYVVFQSDLSRQDFGFSAVYKIVSASPGCDGIPYLLKEKSGEILSPNFGYGQYPSNSECKWVIHVPDSHYVSLSFPEFDVESFNQQPSFGSGPRKNGLRRCSYDFLEIFDGPAFDGSSSFGRYCGTSTPGQAPGTIISSQNTLSLLFRTDFSGERPGFRLQYTAVLPVPGCNGHPLVLHERSGEINSPGFGMEAYPPNSNCMWIVDPDLDQNAFITVSFMHFQVEGRYASATGQISCPYDYVEISLASPYDGADMLIDNVDMFDEEFLTDNQKMKKGPRFCGQSLPAPLTLRGRRLRVRFNSDFNKQDVGFWLRYDIHEDTSKGKEFIESFKNHGQNPNKKVHSQNLMSLLRLTTPKVWLPSELHRNYSTKHVKVGQTEVKDEQSSADATFSTTTGENGSPEINENVLENGEFMLVNDKKHQESKKDSTPGDTVTHSLEGIVIDQSFTPELEFSSGDGEYEFVNEDLESSSSLDDVMSFNPSSVWQSSGRNVTLLSSYLTARSKSIQQTNV